MTTRRTASALRPFRAAALRRSRRPGARALLPRFAAGLGVAAFALLGAAASAQTPQLSVFGAQAADRAGAAVAAIPDMDGDGLQDLVVGAPGDGSPATGPGEVSVVGSVSGAVLLHLVDGDPQGLFGASVAGLPDVDGDGVPDVAVGAPRSAPGQGKATVFSGATGDRIYRVTFDELPQEWDGLGTSIAALPDLDGDAFPDLLIGGPSPGAGGWCLAVLASGRTGKILTTFLGGTSNDFGAAVASVGDVDGDGRADIGIGAPADVPPQSLGNLVVVRSSADLSVIVQLSGSGGHFGAALAGAGDVNGDGVGDIAIGVPGFSRVDVLSGVDQTLLRRYTSTAVGFGGSLTALGDFDGDGYMDYLVGAPHDVPGGLAEAGGVFVVSGNTGTVLFKAPGAAGEQQGSSTALLGAAGPGALLAVGAPGALDPGGVQGGAARLYTGKLVGALVPYGIGCPGSFLITPRIDVSGDPFPGGQLTLSITKALGDTFALLFLGGGQGQIPLPNGCIVWTVPVLLDPITLPLVGPGPGGGNVTLVGTIPPGVPVGTVISFQALVSDPGADGGISSTSAVQLTVQ